MINYKHPKQLLSFESQFYLRLISVFIGVLLNANWFNKKFPERKNVFLIIIVALLIGLYWS